MLFFFGPESELDALKEVLGVGTGREVCDPGVIEGLSNQDTSVAELGTDFSFGYDLLELKTALIEAQNAF